MLDHRLGIKFNVLGNMFQLIKMNVFNLKGSWCVALHKIASIWMRSIFGSINQLQYSSSQVRNNATVFFFFRSIFWIAIGHSTASCCFVVLLFFSLQSFVMSLFLLSLGIFFFDKAVKHNSQCDTKKPKKTRCGKQRYDYKIVSCEWIASGLWSGVRAISQHMCVSNRSVNIQLAPTILFRNATKPFEQCANENCLTKCSTSKSDSDATLPKISNKQYLLCFFFLLRSTSKTKQRH